MQQVWIGIDVAKKDFEASTPEGVTRNFLNNRQGAEEFLAWARAAVPGFSGYIAMEATGVYSLQLAIIFRELKAYPAIINPCQIHSYRGSFGQRNKTDKIDAQLITRFAQERELRLWEPRSKVCENLKMLLEQRDVAKLEQDKMNKQLSTMTSPHKILLQRQQSNQTYIQKLEKEIVKLEAGDPELKKNAKLLRSIPGVGDWSARVILAYLNLKDFTRRSIALYTGLAPCVRHSGTRKGGGHIPHTGPHLIKKYLYMAAQANTQSRMKNPLADFYQKLKAKHKSGKQALCAVMRKILLIARALIISGKPYDSEFNRGTAEVLVEN